MRKTGPEKTKVAEVVDSNAGANAKTVVKGHRVSDKTEKFVLDHSHADEPAVTDAEVLVRCGNCGADSSESEWEANDGDCPGCDWSPDAANEPQGRLSEVELLLESIGGSDNEEEYLLRVDHLPNYFVEGSQKGKANTTAVKSFCRYLRGNEVTIDFMETVRRSCNCPCLKPGEEGRFLFCLSKVNGEDRGFKRRWDETIVKAQVETRPAAPVAPDAPAVAGTKSAREELKEQVDLFKDLYTLMNPAGRQNASPPPSALPPADPFSVAESSLNMLEKAKNLFDRGDTPAGGSTHWVEGAINGLARLGNSTVVVRIGELLVTEGAKIWRDSRTGSPTAGNGEQLPTTATPPSAPRAELPAQPQSPPATDAQSTISPEELAALEQVVNELRAYDGDDDHNLLEERASRAAVAMRSLPKETLAQLLPLPTSFLVTMLAQVNSEWADVADFQDASRFINEVKEILDKPEEKQGSGEVVQFPGKETTEDVDGEQTNNEKAEGSADTNAQAGNKSS